jgi:hypothetical protein
LNYPERKLKTKAVYWLKTNVATGNGNEEDKYEGKNDY